MIKGWKHAGRDLAKHRANVAAAEKRYAVIAITKAGVLSKIPPHPQYDLTDDAAEAERIRVRRETDNPGRKWAVVDRHAPQQEG